jgi:HEAT repeat protein
MSPQDVVAHVKQKDWKLIDIPGQVGADAGPALLPLLNDPDLKVRELAVYCLDASGGKPAGQGMLKALKDKSETVRDAALRFLDRHVELADLPALETEVQKNPDPYVREVVALLVGKSREDSAIAPLQAQYAREPNVRTSHALSLALARLGDATARQAVLGRLKDKNPGQVAQAVIDLIYVDDPKLLVHTEPLLDDPRQGKNVGPSHGPIIKRVCDVVVETMDKMLNHPFTFPIALAHQYTPAELGEAKAVLARLR